MKTAIKIATLTSILMSGAAAIAADSVPDSALSGRWDAVLTRNGTNIPFRLDIKGSGADLQGVFYDGFKPYDGTTSASFKDGKLVLNVEHYLTTINATLKDGALDGSVVALNRDSSAQYGFHAVRHVDTAAVNVDAPSIAGTWIIPLDTPSSKGEKAFRFVVQQQGAEVAASILRIDGDTGSYSGAYKDGKWVLSHFDGGRPGVITVTPQPDGTLKVEQRVARPVASAQEASYGSDAKTANAYGNDTTPDGRYAQVLTAYRSDVAQAKGLPAPEDFLTHTVARDPNEIFTFKYRDVNGKLVSNDDPQFKNKVVLAIVTGTWCPNCHDEAQYLVQLDQQYRDKGLAIVALDFEEPEQQGTLARERAFIKKYGVKYTYLQAGAPAEMWEKVPQLNHLDTWPATVFIGRDGKVKAVHSGFASPASGAFNTELKQEFTARIEHLLAEKQAAATTPASHG
ncbi:MAG TPA: TlpA disulfide reductase family protein [Rhizomicrobium sp.]|nr:TlpA disulfide reductase family protein [Rhizomicrobium sp.]